VSSPSNIVLATEFLFMATILILKVAKRRLFEKVSLERCKGYMAMKKKWSAVLLKLVEICRFYSVAP